ncbi:hypothetical protein OIV83_000626, partial [Microbotryomycetes sp. JL201]
MPNLNTLINDEMRARRHGQGQFQVPPQPFARPGPNYFVPHAAPIAPLPSGISVQARSEKAWKDTREVRPSGPPHAAPAAPLPTSTQRQPSSGSVSSDVREVRLRSGRRINVAAGGCPGDGDVIVIYRFSSPPKFYAAITLQNEHPKDTYLKDVVDFATQAAGAAEKIGWPLSDGVFRVYIVIGSALESPDRWYRPSGSPIIPTADARALMAALPKSHRVAVLGAHGLCVEPELLRDWMERTLRPYCQLLFTTEAGKGDVLQMRADTLTKALATGFSGDQSASTLMKLLELGRDRRRQISQATSAVMISDERVVELHRRQHVPGRASRPGPRTYAAPQKRGPPVDADATAESTSVRSRTQAPETTYSTNTPVNWGTFYRCARNDCLYVGPIQELIKHRDATER